MDSEFSRKVALLLSCKSLLFTKYGGSGSCVLPLSLPLLLFVLLSLSLLFLSSYAMEKGKETVLIFFLDCVCVFDSINSHKKYNLLWI